MSPPTRAMFWLLSALSFSGCVTLGMPDAERHALIGSQQDRQIELRHSLFVGELYDDNERLLLSSLPFVSTTHRLLADGGTAKHPHRELGIYPAGSPFVIHTIEAPTLSARLRRLAASPGSHYWAELALIEGAATPLDPNDKRPLVFVLPAQDANASVVRAAIDSAFAEPGEVSLWLATRPEKVQQAIARKEVFRGMNAADVAASLGAPCLWLVDQFENRSRARVAYYPDKEVWFRQEDVVEVRPSRTLAAARARLPWIDDTQPKG